MLNLKQYLFPIAILLFLSCKNEHPVTYAIRDFAKSLQPCLLRIVSKGIVIHDDSLSQMATDKELVQLGQSEHPVLRALAFREMLHRRTFNHFDLIMNHLDDTATIETYTHEVSPLYRTVSDDLLLKAGWETEESKSKTIDLVLTSHNYLQSAYRLLTRADPQEKYYPYIKDMAIRPRRLSDGYEFGFADIECALYGLAKFKKKEDIIIIKNRLLEKVRKLSDVSFRLMKEFPDTAYLDVLEDYHRKLGYQFSASRNEFAGLFPDYISPVYFIRALAVQQNDRSALLLDTMLDQLSSATCMPDREISIDEAVTGIWEHPCPAYVKLRGKTETKQKEILKRRIKVEASEPFEFVDTTKENIRW